MGASADASNGARTLFGDGTPWWVWSAASSAARLMTSCIKNTSFSSVAYSRADSRALRCGPVLRAVGVGDTYGGALESSGDMGGSRRPCSHKVMGRPHSVRCLRTRAMTPCESWPIDMGRRTRLTRRHIEALRST